MRARGQQVSRHDIKRRLPDALSLITRNSSKVTKQSQDRDNGECPRLGILYPDVNCHSMYGGYSLYGILYIPYAWASALSVSDCWAMREASSSGMDDWNVPRILFIIAQSLIGNIKATGTLPII